MYSEAFYWPNVLFLMWKKVILWFLTKVLTGMLCMFWLEQINNVWKYNKFCVQKLKFSDLGIALKIISGRGFSSPEVSDDRLKNIN